MIKRTAKAVLFLSVKSLELRVEMRSQVYISANGKCSSAKKDGKKRE